jgi:hypothetical protein
LKAGSNGDICLHMISAYRVGSIDSSNGYRLVPQYASYDYQYDLFDPSNQPDLSLWSTTVGINGLNLATSTSSVLATQSYGYVSSGATPTMS